MMKAAIFNRFGTAVEVLSIQDIDQPVAEKDQVLVRMQTSGVNPSDVKKRAGSFPNLLDGGFVVPHSDGAGVIEAVGEGVGADRIGERVWVYQAQFARRFGTAAEYLAIDARRAIPLPDQVSAQVGACLGIPAMTAHRCVFADGEVAGQTILVTGGAGRVGYYAIQWAAAAGATVIASASNDDDAQACRDVGATHIVNHRDDNWSEAVLAANEGKPVERVIDVEFGANLPEVLKCIAVNGVIATYSSTQVSEPTLPFFQMMYMDLTLRTVIVYAMPEAAKDAAIEDITAALKGNSLKHRIHQTLPLVEISSSHELIESGEVRGCVVLNID
ncbi:MAG: NADPH:quinone reductase [Pseudomonadota bacterium]